MSREVLLDANGWVALLNVDDSLHGDAARVWDEIGKVIDLCL
jgi:predicted nucleic acid-binding protein